MPTEVAACRSQLRTVAQVAAARADETGAAYREIGLLMAGVPADAVPDLGRHAGGIDRGHLAPLLLCERAAARRRLDLERSAADARHWWQTRTAPCDPTPTADQARMLRAVRWPAYGLYAAAGLTWAAVVALPVAVWLRGGNLFEPICFGVFPALAGLFFLFAGFCLRTLSVRIAVLGACAILVLTQVGIPLAAWVVFALSRPGVWDAFDSVGVSLGVAPGPDPAGERPRGRQDPTPIAIACPRCGKRATAPGAAEGKTAQCKKCGERYPIFRAAAPPSAPPN
ncbi:hypothetical protein [Urbifossiella limnaea]|uniref:Uncharacterized protein n=1 Tax=Urbifossiella limnaea TaxID=2528023 RepID=A0A517Y1Y3_9BACT|nr:hypothetical protein [Urbifossiella limnaea]QDU23780.1 hypothetical protein ETAA1_57870 [Urbifossiella limnaea]